MSQFTTWIQSRQGKVLAGAGAAVLVVLMALRKRAGTAAGSGFLPSAIQPSTDGTLASQLDQFNGAGGTLSELINAARDQTAATANLTDLLQAQNPLPKTVGSSPDVVRLRQVKSTLEGRLKSLYDQRKWWGVLLNNPHYPQARRQLAGVDAEKLQVLHALSTVNAQLTQAGV